MSIRSPRRLKLLAALPAIGLGVAMMAAPHADALPCRDCGGGGGGGGGGVTTPVLPKMAVYSVGFNNFGQTVCRQASPDQILCGYVPDTLPANDNIDVSESSGSVGTITVVLETAPQVTWYKEIKAFDNRGNTLGWVATSDGAHGPVSMTLPAASVAALVFTKAGFAGVHVGEYDLRGVSAKSGRTETFNWTAD